MGRKTEGRLMPKIEPLTDAQCREALEAYKKHGSQRAAARAMGLSKRAIENRLQRAYERGLAPDPVETARREHALKMARLEKSVAELRLELKKAEAERLTNDGVRRMILGAQRVLTAEDPDPEWTEALDRGQYRFDGDVPTAIWSDFHAGEVVRPEQVQFVNQFDMAIMARRFQTLLDSTVLMFKNHLSARQYPGFVLLLGGDMVTGDIHQELSETNEDYVMPIVLDVHRMLRQGITRLADVFGRVHVVCVFGNHGRTNPKPQHKDAAFKNFDWMLYCFLAEWFRNDPRITFKIPDDDEVLFTVAGHRYRLTHGNQFRGGQGFIGAMAPIMRGEHKKRIAAQSYGLPHDTLVLAHWHQCRWWQRVVVNGSLKGYDEYAMDGNFEFELPKQMTWITSRTFGACSPMEIYCEHPQTAMDGFQGQDWWERSA